jgi:putative transcriptional regulator
MTADERRAAALADPDAKPLTPADFARMKRTPQVRTIRRALGLSQEEFATRFHISLGTLRDWEQGRKAPGAAARAYLVVIGRNPSAVAEALRPGYRSAATIFTGGIAGKPSSGAFAAVCARMRNNSLPPCETFAAPAEKFAEPQKDIRGSLR